MNEFKFKIRLYLVPDFDCGWDETEIYIDTLPKGSVVIHRILGDYDWLDRTAGAPKDTKDRNAIIQRNIMLKDYGFTDLEVCMDAEFHEGYLEVSIITDKDFNGIRGIIDDWSHTVTKLTLKDAIKKVINGKLSDGIGENEIGYATYNFKNYEVWLGEIVTDEPLEENNGYFKINILETTKFDGTYLD